MTNCIECHAEFSESQLGALLRERTAPVLSGEAFGIPPPKSCPRCRNRRRYAFRNDQNLQRCSCSLCGATIIGFFSPSDGVKALCEECFWSDNWDPYSYGREFDFTRPFFPQFLELKRATPRVGSFKTRCENSIYTVHSSGLNSCYLVSSGRECEEVLYSDFVFHSKRSLDLLGARHLELCCECLHCRDCYACTDLEWCFGLSDSTLCFDCRGGDNLFGCVGLRRGSNFLFNKPSSKEAVTAARRRFNSDREFRKHALTRFSELCAAHRYPPFYGINVEEADGNYLNYSRRVSASLNVNDSEDICYSYDITESKDLIDCCRAGSGEALYFCSATIDLRYSAFCNLCYQCHQMLYCDNCQAGSHDCFGSISLKRGEYTLLNVQYTQKQYNDLAKRLVRHMRDTGEWGEFFPASHAPYPYNISKAQEWYPLTQIDAEALGYRWKDDNDQPESARETTAGEEALPLDIAKVDDSVLKRTFCCRATGKPYRIAQLELEIRRALGVPIPELAPQARHRARVARQMGEPPTDRSCADCGAQVRSSIKLPPGARAVCGACYETALQHS